MDLVDRDRLAQRRPARAAALHPVVVLPLVPGAEDDRRGLRRHLGGARVGVGAQRQRAVLGAELELVAAAVGHAGDEQLPDPGRAERAHRVQAPVPRVEVADDADRARRRGPDGERHALDAVDLEHVRAELLVELLVAPLAGQVEVDLPQRGQERVRVAHRERPALAVLDVELVAQRQSRARHRALEDAAGVAQLELDRVAALGSGDDLGGVGPVGADHHAAVLGMRAEQPVRLGEVAVDDGLDVCLHTHGNGSSSRRAIPATGIRTQSGRLLSS